jgi:hypothetical protein
MVAHRAHSGRCALEVIGEIGPDLFRHACRFGLEGLVVLIAAARRSTG